MNLVYIDTETTGLDPETCRVIQLAARLVIEGKTVDFNSFIQPPTGLVIPEPAFAVHGITAEFAQINGIPLTEVLDAFAAMLAAADAVVGHFVQFDVKFIAAEARHAGRHQLASDILNKPQICTKQMCAAFLERFGEPSGRSETKLSVMFERLTNESLDDAHDAFVDVLACEQIHQRILAA